MKYTPIAVLVVLFALDAWAQAKAPAPAAPSPQTRELRILQKVMPSYSPTAATRDGGCVTVKFVIKHDGFVGDITVLEAKPEALAEPTIAALKQWWFQSFPPPDLTAVQTFHFAPELVKLPDDAIRSSYGVATEEGALKSASCGAKEDKAAGVAAGADAPSDGGIKVIKRPMPHYPVAAAQHKVEGCVVVSFVVLPDGRADQYQVLDSQPRGVFDQATLKALNEWRFEVPERAGRYAQAMQYRLKQDGKVQPMGCKPVPTYEQLNPGAASR